MKKAGIIPKKPTVRFLQEEIKCLEKELKETREFFDRSNEEKKEKVNIAIAAIMNNIKKLSEDFQRQSIFAQRLYRAGKNKLEMAVITAGASATIWKRASEMMEHNLIPISHKDKIDKQYTV